MRNSSRSLLATLITGVAVITSAASAQAGILSSLTGGGATCDSGTLTKPFSPWGDRSDYAAVPGGNFESGLSGWTGAGPVQVRHDNEPWQVSGASDSSSLELSPGSTVICGGATSARVPAHR